MTLTIVFSNNRQDLRELEANPYYAAAIQVDLLRAILAAAKDERLEPEILEYLKS